MSSLALDRNQLNDIQRAECLDLKIPLFCHQINRKKTQKTFANKSTDILPSIKTNNTGNSAIVSSDFDITIVTKETNITKAEESLKSFDKRSKAQNSCDKFRKSDVKEKSTQINADSDLMSQDMELSSDSEEYSIVSEKIHKRDNSYNSINYIQNQTINSKNVQIFSISDSILADVVLNHCLLFNYMSSANVWQIISADMARLGMTKMNSILCRNRFIALTLSYSQVFWSQQDFQSKCSLFPLFLKFYSIGAKNPILYYNTL